MITIINSISKNIDHEIKLIVELHEQSKGKQIVAAKRNEETLLNEYRRIENLFRRLQISRLGELNPAKLAAHDSTHGTEVNRRTCTKNTRETILQDLDNWSDDTEAKRIYWMNGMAGTGKTTIACSLAQALEARGQLGGSFFCSQTSPECRDANRIIPTIAYQLAHYSTSFRAALFRVLDGDPDLGSRNITTQFERLLKNPLMESKEQLLGNIIVVIDALDECDSPRAVKLILEALLKYTLGLPIKFFVTSRPDPRIYDNVSQNSYSSGIMHLHEIEHSIVRSDIELYLKEELALMAPKEGQILQLSNLAGNLFIYAATAVRYIQPDDVFIDSEERLEKVLSAQLKSSKRLTDLDNLYSAILTAALKNERLERDEVLRIQLVLWTSVCSREPVDIDTLTALVGMGETKHIMAALKPLRSVLHVSETTGLVSALHASFPDYMLSRERANGFHCDKEGHHLTMATRCFEIMSSELRFNICNLTSSFLPDSAVPNLDIHVAARIPSTLFYACQYWGDHFALASESSKIGQKLNDFLSHHLLFWMEAMNLKNCLKTGLSVLLDVQKRVMTCEKYQSIRRNITDAHTFLTRTIATPIIKSTPHIYISALQFCPRSSSVFTNYSGAIQERMDVSGSAVIRRNTAPLATWDTEYGLNCFALFPDGTRIATGSSEGTINVWDTTNGILVSGPTEARGHSVLTIGVSPDSRLIVAGYEDGTLSVWNATNGSPVSGPFNGHFDSVLAVAFAGDNIRIVSGSRDRTIHIRNALNGVPIARPLEGHTDSIQSVAVSPNGKRIVSGSADHSVRIWNSVDGAPVGAPLLRHNGPVWSVQFSPDGTSVVSGADDNLVLVWDVADGRPPSLRSVLEGHTEGVVCVGFSPDSEYIVSGSYDCTIRMWNAAGGHLISGPFERHVIGFQSVGFSPYGTWFYSGSSNGTICLWDASCRTILDGVPRGHTSSVESVQFSLDGTHIVSGSEDHTICMWDTREGKLAVGPFKGHTAGVISAVLSPDGTRVVSGAFDHTICIWDSAEGSLILGPCRGHESWVKCVEFSPDGASFVSCSDDGTICVWDATQGTPIVGPFKQHNSSIHSVGFSPDGNHLVSGASDGTICISESATGKLLHGPYKRHSDWISSVSFSPDGKLIASGAGVKDRTICIWSADGKELLCGPLRGHDGGVLALSFSSDGQRIVSSSDDRTIRVWNPKTGDLILGPLKAHHQSVRSVRFSPDGRQIVTGSRDQTIRIHDVEHSRNHSSALDGIWEITDDGWFTNEKSQLLFWAPPEIRRSFPRPYNPLTIGPEGSLQVDYSQLLIGENWHECYKRS
ncbi:Vegetative incompatibility protein HET-E-1 OS=Podospora anserina GN=HET-E1 PE=4 SV=1 [Rhizoctonia solani AG-1 IB]|uniref:Vegetative incompatibility protein HET-E-1 n=1 Tax=Thanatephorus cucumeris (strain AG1-IB / isolate 7/3/14) TaxID=1108050 RepID=A0A0B7FWH2_THACB|nr:Vegetative incompatibility protein HET-E-1 OS=Podospora anserina GN=HET-E1 PE=4 SV=1 [Rhizoctonia solani AG-1 IB]